jgi:hypothetical protein
MIYPILLLAITLLYRHTDQFAFSRDIRPSQAKQ